MPSTALRVSYPALFTAADSAANAAQASLLWHYKTTAVLLTLAAMLALFSGTQSLAIASAVVFLLSLGAHILAEFRQYQRRWYQARALAESVKTTTWRFVMGADPFSGSQSDLKLFRDRLSELLTQNVGIASDLSGDWSSSDQVTPDMLLAHGASPTDKLAFYREHRIDEQLSWYMQKARGNKDSARKFFIGTSCAYVVAVVLLLVRVGQPTIDWLPIEVLAVVASSLIGWKQLRRFEDLASAYNLTAHEVGIIKSRFNEVTDTPSLSSFVSDSENAFSREHTQWAARRDHIR